MDLISYVIGGNVWFLFDVEKEIQRENPFT